MIDSLLLVAESHVESGPLIGFHFDFLESNTFNLAILVGILVFYGSKIIKDTLAERHNSIALSIQEAEKKQQQAITSLAQEEKKLAQAQIEAERIHKAAQERAVAIKAEILAQKEKDIARLKETAAADLSSEQERVIAQLKKQIAEQAIVKAEEQLKSKVDNNVQQTLINRNIDRLGGS